MDKNDTLRNLLISVSIFLLVLWIWPRLLPPPPQQTYSSTTGQAAGPVAQPVDPGIVQPEPHEDAGETGIQDEASAGFAFLEADNEQTLAMGSGPAEGIDKEVPSPYRMRLTLSNVGASVESATMTDHAEDLGSDQRYILLSTIERDDGRRFRSLAIEQINVDGIDLPLHDKKWHAEPVKTTDQDQSALFWIEIQQDGAPALKLTRTFMLPKQERESGRHDLQSEIRVENLSDQSHRVIITYRGGLGIRRAGLRMDDRFIDWGVHDGTHVVGNREGQGVVTKSPGHPVVLFVPSAAEPNTVFSWAATANTYFTCTIAPLGRDGHGNAKYLAEVSALDADGDALSNDDATLRLVTRAEALGPGSALIYPADIYLGEKDGDVFREVPEYLERNYYYQVAQAYPWCTFAWLVELMVLLLNGLFWMVRDFGVAIIILVLIVRALLHPITKKGQVNMVRMQQRMGDFAPKVEELKKKFANDKARLQQETMKLYREHGINPTTQFLTCLPMVIQLPIWVALWISLSNNILMRHEPFHFTWIHDLTAPDALYTFPAPIVVPFFGWELPAFNLLPILLGIFMYLQQKLQPKPKPNPNATDQQRQQQEMMQKMMPLMSVMMLVLFYKAPSGLTLYIMSSSLFGVIEQHWIRKHIKQREATGTLVRKAQKDDVRLRPRKKLSIFQKLQKMAEDAQKTQAKKAAKSKSRR